MAETIITSEDMSGYEDCVANNIPSRGFRYTVENKNILSKPGSIYVGTGLTRTSKMKLDDNSVVEFQSYITAVLDVPEEEGFSLQTKNVKFTLVIDKDTTREVEGIFPCWVKGDTVITPHFVGEK